MGCRMAYGSLVSWIMMPNMILEIYGPPATQEQETEGDNANILTGWRWWGEMCVRNLLSDEGSG
jgi:hypothetical protein